MGTQLLPLVTGQPPPIAIVRDGAALDFREAPREEDGDDDRPQGDLGRFESELSTNCAQFANSRQPRALGGLLMVVDELLNLLLQRVLLFFELLANCFECLQFVALVFEPYQLLGELSNLLEDLPGSVGTANERSHLLEDHRGELGLPVLCCQLTFQVLNLVTLCCDNGLEALHFCSWDSSSASALERLVHLFLYLSFWERRESIPECCSVIVAC
jgi:hypothetical protein